MKNIILLLIYFSIILSSCEESTKMYVGGIYTIENAETKQNFGKYLILESKKTKGFYNFKSFDVENNEPIGKLITALSTDYKYKEAKFNREFVIKAHKACDERMSEESGELQKILRDSKNQSTLLKEKFNINKKYILNKFSKIRDSEFNYAIWLNVEKETFIIHIYSREKIARADEIKWLNDPMWGISNEDQSQIIKSLDKMVFELEN